jgi:hypothetical protein
MVYTAPTLGPSATSYLLTAVPQNGGVTAAVTTTSATSGTITGASAGGQYKFSVAARNANGSGPATLSETQTIPTVYGLTTFTTSGTITTAAFASEISGYVIGGGSNGQSGSAGNPSGNGSGGRGGYGGGIIGFKSIPVSSNTVITVTVGAAGGVSKITIGGTDIITANGGTTSAVGATSSSYTSGYLVTTATLGTGGAGGTQTNGERGTNGGNGTNPSTTSITTGVTGVTALTLSSLGGGGGGGAGGNMSEGSGNPPGGSATQGGGAGGAGGTASSGSGGEGVPGSAATQTGAGGGGGGGGGSYYTGSQQSKIAGGGGAGYQGAVYLWIK